MTNYLLDKQYQVGVLFKPTATEAAAHRLLGTTSTTTHSTSTTTHSTSTTTSTTTTTTASNNTNTSSYCKIDQNGDHWDGFLTSYNHIQASFDPHHLDFTIEDLYPVVPASGVWQTNIYGTNATNLLRDCHEDWSIKDKSTVECDLDHCTISIWAYRPLVLHSYDDFDLTPAELQEYTMIAFYNTYSQSSNQMYSVNGISSPFLVYMNAVMLTISGLYSVLFLII